MMARTAPPLRSLEKPLRPTLQQCQPCHHSRANGRYVGRLNLVQRHKGAEKEDEKKHLFVSSAHRGWLSISNAVTHDCTRLSAHKFPSATQKCHIRSRHRQKRSILYPACRPFLRFGDCCCTASRKSVRPDQRKCPSAHKAFRPRAPFQTSRSLSSSSRAGRRSGQSDRCPDRQHKSALGHRGKCRTD